MIDVRIPQMGMSTLEVEVCKVYVRPGDQVGADTVVVEVESEKATVEIQAGVAGTVGEVLVEEGGEARVGDVVVRIQ